jgi:hypothetical protein
MEANDKRVEHDEPEQQGEADVRPLRNAELDIPPPPIAEGQIELPVLRYPTSEVALTSWFRTTYFRAPSERELGMLMIAMNRRDSTPPHVGPEPDLPGWETTPPATRR